MEAKLKILTKQYDEVGTVDTIEVDTIGKIFEKNKIYLSTLQFLDENKINHNSEDMLEQLKNKITFDHWFFAHYHINRNLDEKFTCLFEDFREVR